MTKKQRFWIGLAFALMFAASAIAAANTDRPAALVAGLLAAAIHCFNVAFERATLLDAVARASSARRRMPKER